MKRLLLFATTMLLAVSCIKVVLPTKKGAEADEAATETEAVVEAVEVVKPNVPMVYSKAYDGFVNVRCEPTTRSEIICKLPNGPEGAELLGVEGKWTKVRIDGYEGYVSSAYVQSTPTKPVYVDAGFVVGAWRQVTCPFPIDYLVFSDGTYALYHDGFMEGAVSEAGKWYLEENSIVFNKAYDFAYSEVMRSVTRFNIDTNQHQFVSKDSNYKRTYDYTPASLESWRKYVKSYAKM